MIKKHHYLGKQGFSFRSGYNYGLFCDDVLIGVAVFHSVSAPETVQGCFGLARNEQDGIWELGRLVIHPNYKIKSKEYKGKNVIMITVSKLTDINEFRMQKYKEIK